MALREDLNQISPKSVNTERSDRNSLTGFRTILADTIYANLTKALDSFF